MTTFEDYGLTVADVQSLMSTDLHPTILFAFCHGIHTCIFFIALYYIIESTQPNRKRITLASIITFLWIANTVILSLDWEYTGLLFISHGTSLETEFNFSISGDLPLSLPRDVLRLLCVLVADLILVWRCWVLYGGNLKVIAVPSLFVITETIGACVVIVSSIANWGFAGASRVNWSLVYYSMTVATNGLCTLLILFRILRVSGIGASLKTYRGIIEILVESAAMYAIIYIALLTVYAYEYYNNSVTVMTAYAYPQVISYSVTGIAPTLIIARVMAGQSRPDDSWTRPSLPHMRSDVLSATESLQFASGPNQTGSTQTTSGHGTANIDLEAQVEIVEEHRGEEDGGIVQPEIVEERRGDGDGGDAGQKRFSVKV